MAAYVICIAVDRIMLGTEPSVVATLKRCGFTEAVRSAELSEMPPAWLLFVGESSENERRLASQVEDMLRFELMCQIRVLVFRSDKLRPRPTYDSTSDLQLVPSYLN